MAISFNQQEAVKVDVELLHGFRQPFCRFFCLTEHDFLFQNEAVSLERSMCPSRGFRLEIKHKTLYHVVLNFITIIGRRR